MNSLIEDSHRNQPLRYYEDLFFDEYGIEVTLSYVRDEMTGARMIHVKPWPLLVERPALDDPAARQWIGSLIKENGGLRRTI